MHLDKYLLSKLQIYLHHCNIHLKEKMYRDIHKQQLKLQQQFIKALPHGEKKTFDAEGKMTRSVFDMGKKKS